MTDETRFRAFYQVMFPKLWRYVHHMIANHSECDDLVQESFFRFLRAAASHPDDKAERAYLYRIATNLVRDKWRAHSSEADWLSLDTDHDELPAPSQDVGVKLDIERALKILSPGQRSLVWLAYVDGYDHHEIAAIVGIKSASVRVLLMRARQRLAGFLNDPAPQKEDS